MEYLILFLTTFLLGGAIALWRLFVCKRKDVASWLSPLLSAGLILLVYFFYRIFFYFTLSDIILTTAVLNISIYSFDLLGLFRKEGRRGVRPYAIAAFSLLLVCSFLLRGSHILENVYAEIGVGQYCVLALLAFFAIFSLKKASRLANLEPNKKFEPFLWGIMGVLLFVFVLYSFFNTSRYYLAYPLNYDSFVIAKNPYTLLFEGFQSGHLYLNIEPDPRLAELANPYEYRPSGIHYLWDFAYFKGKYYVYFGVAPVLVFYYPVYWLSFGHFVPTYAFINHFLYIICIFASINALHRVVTYYKKTISKPFFALAALCLFVAGGYGYLAFAEPMYNTPILFGTTALYLLIYFAFLGMSKESPIAFLFMGISFVLIIASRPNLAFAILILLPALIRYLCKHRFTTDLKQFWPCFSALAIGAILICCYNYFRFGSPLDFGANYQLTVSDVSKNKIALEKFPIAMAYYLFQTPSSLAKSPFMNLGLTSIKDYHLSYYVYTYPTLGLAFFPVCLFAFAGLVKSKRVDFLLQSVCLLLFILLLSFLDFSLAGVHIRYSMDILPTTMFFCCANLVCLGSSLEKRAGKISLFGVSFLLVLATCYFACVIYLNNGYITEMNSVMKDFIAEIVDVRLTYL